MQLEETPTQISNWIITNSWGVITAILVLIAGWILSRLASKAIKDFANRTAKVDKTIAPLLSQLSRYAILIVAIIIALSQLGVATTSMLAVLGAAGLAIALALQGTLSNVAAGVMIIWLRPFSIGEYIAGTGIEGTIIEIGLFSTKLKTGDGLYIFAPNAKLWSASITNYDREEHRRINMKIGISYDADISKARKILLKIATSDDRVLPDPAPVIHVDSLGNNAVILSFRSWVKTPDYYDVSFAFNEQVKLAFDKAKIEIPYNKLDVNLSGTQIDKK
jgi:small conductance mechanosensitive channel